MITCRCHHQNLDLDFHCVSNAPIFSYKSKYRSSTYLNFGLDQLVLQFENFFLSSTFALLQFVQFLLLLLQEFISLLLVLLYNNLQVLLVLVLDFLLL